MRPQSRQKGGDNYGNTFGSWAGYQSPICPCKQGNQGQLCTADESGRDFWRSFFGVLTRPEKVIPGFFSRVLFDCLLHHYLILQYGHGLKKPSPLLGGLL